MLPIMIWKQPTAALIAKGDLKSAGSNCMAKTAPAALTADPQQQLQQPQQQSSMRRDGHRLAAEGGAAAGYK
jgi:hypothetical protein